MSNQHMDEEIENQKKIDEAFKILYMTFMIMGVIFFFWLLLVIFNDQKVPGLEEMNNEEHEGEAK